MKPAVKMQSWFILSKNHFLPAGETSLQRPSSLILFHNNCSVAELHHPLMPFSVSRQEYRPWTGAKPAKSARKNPPAEYFSQVSEAAHSQCRTSYQAAYSSDTHRSTGLHQGEQTVPSAVSNPQPAAAPQPIAAALPAVRSSSPPSLQQNIPPERMELGGRIKGEVKERKRQPHSSKDTLHHSAASASWLK